MSARAESRSGRLGRGVALAVAGVALALVAAALVVVVLARTASGDAIVRELVERRVAAAVAAALESPARVDLGPEPVAPRLLDGRLGRVQVAARWVPIEGLDARLSSLHATLRAVRLDLGEVLDPTSRVALRAAGGSYEAVLGRRTLERLVSFPGVRVRPGRGALTARVWGEHARLRVTGRGDAIIVRPDLRVEGAMPAALARVDGLPLGVQVDRIRVAPDGVHVRGPLPQPVLRAADDRGEAAVEFGAPRR